MHTCLQINTLEQLDRDEMDISSELRNSVQRGMMRYNMLPG